MSNSCKYKIYNGNCLDVLDELDENSIDSIVTDPPYELNFMGNGWDNSGVSFNKNTWEKCLRVLKPGGYLLAFGGSRTYHRIACAIEDAGFEIRDCIMWLYGSGFPKSMDISKQIDKKFGAEREVIGTIITNKTVYKNIGGKSINDKINITIPETDLAKQWQGWGTALKPAYEPIIVARKPFKDSLVDNVMKYGVGGINIDECRVMGNDLKSCYRKPTEYKDISPNAPMNASKIRGSVNDDYLKGRFPANTILTYDENDFDEVCGGFPQSKGGSGKGFKKDDYGFSETATNFGRGDFKPYNDNGSASRYFYCAKASKKDRDEGLDEFSEKTKVFNGQSDTSSKNIKDVEKRFTTSLRNIHPTVKPTSLMQYLVRLVSPKGSIILDPFMGSGSTGKAVMYENKERNARYKFIGIEKDGEYCKIAEARIKYVGGEE